MIYSSKLIYLFIAFIFLIIDFSLYNLFLILPPDHHIVETIIDMNRITRGSIWDYHLLSHASTKPLYYFFAHFFYQVLDLDGLRAFILTGIIGINFALCSLIFVVSRYIKEPLLICCSILFFFFSFKYLQILPMTLEDNLSYYGFLILFLYFFTNSIGSNRNILFAGVTLGVACCFHAVMNIYSITIFLAIPLLYFKNINFNKSLIIPVLAITLSVIVTILLPDSHSNITHIISRVLEGRTDTTSSLFTSSDGAIGAFFITFGKLLNGIDHKNDTYADYRYFLSYFFFTVLFGVMIRLIYIKKLFKETSFILSISALITSIIFLISYGATRTGRWDLFAICLFFIYLQTYSKHRSIIIEKIVLTIIIFGVIDLGYRPLKSVPIEDSCHQDIYYSYYLKEKSKMEVNKSGTYFLPWEYLAISGHLATHFPVGIDNMFFISPDGRFFKARVSLFVRMPDQFIQRGEELDFFGSNELQKELTVDRPNTRGFEYRSPFLRKVLTNCLPK